MMLLTHCVQDRLFSGARHCADKHKHYRGNIDRELELETVSRMTIKVTAAVTTIFEKKTDWASQVTLEPGFWLARCMPEPHLFGRRKVMYGREHDKHHT